MANTSRHSSLDRDPAGVRAWQDRSRERARERAREKRRGEESRGDRGLKRRAGHRKATIPQGVRQAAINRSLGLCVACLCRESVDPHRLSIAALGLLVRRGVVRAAVQLHHVLPEQRWRHLAKNGAHLVGVCFECHDAHERASVRIPRAALPASALELAEAEGLMWYIEDTYP